MQLSDLKILDFSTLLPGPYASLILADMGAQVLKISAPDRPDLVLQSPPYLKDGKRNAHCAWLGRNKETISLNLKEEQSIQIIKRLIVEQGYTIILEQFRPGVMAKFDLDYESLQKICPDIIYCSLTGYGQSGPYKDKAGHDINYLSLSGVMSHSCRKGETPSPYGVQIADLAIGSLHSVIGILAAVHHREKTGQGDWIDVSMMDGMIPFNSLNGCDFLLSGKEPGREDDLLNGGSAYDFYSTKDGESISVGSLEPKFWKSFCTVLGKPEWITGGVDAENIKEKKEEIRQIFKSKTRKEWEFLFAKADACVEPVKNLREALLEDEHIKARELIVTMKEDAEEVKQFAMPIHFTNTKPIYRHMGKAPGSDTENVLTRLGYAKEDIHKMKEKGIY